MPDRRPLSWIGQAAKEFRDLPEEAQDAVIFQLGRVQDGKMPDDFKKVQGIKGATVFEFRERYETNTYRCVYTAQLQHAIYVLTCFMKKSRQGIKTDPNDLTRIQRRLRVAIEEDARSEEAQKTRGRRMDNRGIGTMDDEDLRIIHGTDNPFADLGLPNAVERNIKVSLAHAIRNAVEIQTLPQHQAAVKAAIAQGDLSNVLRGRVTGFSVERLLKVLANLGQDIDITIGPKRGDTSAISVRYDTNAALPASAIQRR